MRSITARTSTDTGHFSIQPGLGHSMQRSDSCRACSAGKPRFTSWKLWARAWGSCSGTRWRGSLMRSLLGSGLLLGGLVMARLHRVQRAGVPRILFSELFQLCPRIGLQELDAGPLLFAVHIIALHQDLEVDLRGVKVGAIHAGELTAVVDQYAAAAAH